MEQKEPFEFTDKDLELLRKINAMMQDSDGLSYDGLIGVFSSIVYSIQRRCCISKIKESGVYKGILDLIDDIEKDLDAVSGFVSQCVKDELAQLLDEDAKKEPNTNI